MDELGGTMGLKNTLVIGIHMLKRIEMIHKCGIIHRDLKPENFLFGINNKIVYLIDFGLATAYKQGGVHIKQKRGSLIGTENFASVNVCNGITPSRRDDIESIGYIMIYLLLGELPWMDDDKRTYDLCKLPRIVPREIINLINYCRDLGFDQEPNYKYIIMLIKNLYTSKNYAANN